MGRIAAVPEYERNKVKGWELREGGKHCPDDVRLFGVTNARTGQKKKKESTPNRMGNKKRD